MICRGLMASEMILLRSVWPVASSRRGGSGRWHGSSCLLWASPTTLSWCAWPSLISRSRVLWPSHVLVVQLLRERQHAGRALAARSWPRRGSGGAGSGHRRGRARRAGGVGLGLGAAPWRGRSAGRPLGLLGPTLGRDQLAASRSAWCTSGPECAPAPSPVGILAVTVGADVEVVLVVAAPLPSRQSSSWLTQVVASSVRRRSSATTSSRKSSTSSSSYP